MERRDGFASSGRTAVLVAVDGRGAGVIALADAVRETSAEAVAALHELGVEVVMLSGDNEATAQRIAGQLGIDTVIAEVLPGDKAAKVAELQQAGRRVAMVGDGVNDPRAGPGRPRDGHRRRHGRRHRDRGRGADALRPPRRARRAAHRARHAAKMRQNLGWAVGYNAIALPIAAGVFEPSLGLVLRPEMAALSMSGSSVIVAVNALMLKRLRLPAPPPAPSRSRRRQRDSSRSSRPAAPARKRWRPSAAGPRWPPVRRRLVIESSAEPCPSIWSDAARAARG